jgi:hypothetical protein
LPLQRVSDEQEKECRENFYCTVDFHNVFDVLGLMIVRDEMLGIDYLNLIHPITE